ncbi:MAG: DEAD/DEAH box helicase [Gammaproteobacteria bacterium]
MQTIHMAVRQLRLALMEYIEATYHISSPALIAQRKALLNSPGVIFQIPYLESTPRYKAGATFSELGGLPPAALKVFEALSSTTGGVPRLLYDPPYLHQAQTLQHSLSEKSNVVIMTGTGSGKTESFLMPILGKLANEAATKPTSFAGQPAVRALVLYPMNALVNDQLGRLRGLFGDARVRDLFMGWAGRPPRFARYTSRTPYAGVRVASKDTTKLAAFEKFYAGIQRLITDGDDAEKQRAKRLLAELQQRGKWPAKPDIAAWYGEKGSRWQDPQTGDFRRAITLPDDSELVTRHEVQAAPPDLLVTNYSMLEYMLMRPVERPIFDATCDWLRSNPDERFLVVLDEAHLYRGAAGAEVGLLLRRLRDRLGATDSQFQVICATASFSNPESARRFGAQLSGLPENTFVSITGTLHLASEDGTGGQSDIDALRTIELEKFYEANTDKEKLGAIREFLQYRGVEVIDAPESTLFRALCDFAPLKLLINSTMKEAMPIASLAEIIFPGASQPEADQALTALLALGSVARPNKQSSGLLPCRIHNFFRGLPGLWICLDTDCSEVSAENKNAIGGQLFSQPRTRCRCGARVFELFTCRNCGTAYARAYTDDVDSPRALWAEPGEHLFMGDDDTRSLFPIDLLLESPLDELAEPVDLDVETGRLNPNVLGPRTRTVFLRGVRTSDVNEDGQPRSKFEERGKFNPCGVCGKTAGYGRSPVQDHQTKGDEPFQALVARQLQIQPPSSPRPTQFAPLQGRKVLAFSDSRQVAARLAPKLQTLSVRDSLRPLIAWGFRKLQGSERILPNLNLDDLYLAVLLASNELGVRLRPEMKASESFEAEEMVGKAVRDAVTNTREGLLQVWMDVRGERPPEALLDSIVTAVRDKYLGFEALALGSIVERRRHSEEIAGLPDIVGIAENPSEKSELVRAWIRCWSNKGFWLNGMPGQWWREKVQGDSGKFPKAMSLIIRDTKARAEFAKVWLPILLSRFTKDMSGIRQLSGSELSLQFDGYWVQCAICKSVHRPMRRVAHCIDCGRDAIRQLDPDVDAVFLARKGFYRNPVLASLANPPAKPMALIAAEHTAQLNAPQSEDVFSKAEENELLFQDVDISGISDGRGATAVDVLSSTTTMEVGIDIGELSGVALRNMPPGRSNYQQRAGRAGRRGSAVATVVAFGSADSHDEHFFSTPALMITGPVIDPKLTLSNIEIVRRHIRAFLLQNYHQSRIQGTDRNLSHDLFSVLGTVSGFRDRESLLNRHDFAGWLSENESRLRLRVDSWIPHELAAADRAGLLDEMRTDCLTAIDQAIDYVEPENVDTPSEPHDNDEPDSENEEDTSVAGRGSDQLLGRLLYRGILPRYAFPTDVATFHVFDVNRSSRFKAVMRFVPSQGLPVALSQYAPGKQVWIAGKCYTSGAIYSTMPSDRFSAWQDRRIYMECSACGFARTYLVEEANRGEIKDCEACGGMGTFGPARYWLRPPGFAHPVDVEEVTSPETMPDVSYATRAKLTMPTPDDGGRWTRLNDRLRTLSVRQHLLVSNTGPDDEGYTYCVKCGRIESSVERDPKILGGHRKPYPSSESERVCDGVTPSKHLVLGTDFITDIALFSLRVATPLKLRPGHSSTIVALRTLSEAVAQAACLLLEVEAGELLAEFRPALTPDGKEGLEAEIFLYDALPGGAGFSTQVAARGIELLQGALHLMKTCPENCDASCYRCLRSFKNKFEHRLLDRHVGAQLLEYLLDGNPTEFSEERVQESTSLLFADLQRMGASIQFSRDAGISESGVIAPILAKRADDEVCIVALSAPLTTDYPADRLIARYSENGGAIPVLVVNELTVRANLPAATRQVLAQLGE